ncbi:glycosyltransferase family 2 protein [Methylobacterium sp. A54F]
MPPVLGSLFPYAYDVLLAHGSEDAPAEGAVTVAVSLFNYADYVLEALESVRAQTHGPLELIVVDDASTDAGVAQVRTWMEAHRWRFGRMRLVRHTENAGLPQARNTAFALARTDHVLVLDADNALHPPAIAKLHRAIRRGDYGLAYAQIEQFGAGRSIGQAWAWDADLLGRGNYVDAMALVARAAWARAGGYAALDLGWEDYDLWLTFAGAGIRGIFVPEILCRYRVHAASMLRTGTDLRQHRVRAQIAARHGRLRE